MKRMLPPALLLLSAVALPWSASAQACPPVLDHSFPGLVGAIERLLAMN